MGALPAISTGKLNHLAQEYLPFFRGRPRLQVSADLKRPVNGQHVRTAGGFLSPCPHVVWEYHMTDASPDVARLAGAVAGLFDGPITRNRPPVWRAWTPDGRLLLFESEHEDVARLLVVLLSSQLGSRPVLLESPDGADRYYRDGRWQATPDDESDEHPADHAHRPAPRRLRLIVTSASPRGA